MSQTCLAAGRAASRLVDHLEAGSTDWHDVERARFAVNALTSALAPTNTLLGNPAALQRTFDTAGASVLRGLGHFAPDVRYNGGMPTQTDRSAFAVGEDLAITPGAVVARDDVAELIQYTPTTTTVRPRPVLVIPPPIGRYYVLDLRPGRSFVEFALSQGLQLFTPWTGCCRTTGLLSGPSTFVLSNAGHVASLVNPPGSPKASCWAGGEPGPDPAAWRDTADRRTGSWWEAWATWVLERSGAEVEAPAELGSDRHPPLEPAPSSYVLDRVP